MAIDTIGTNAIANDAVTAAKIPAGAVDADITAIPDGSVTTAKIADNAVTSAKALNLGRRNLIINGAMQVAQRATSATGLGNGGGYNTLDRHRFSSGNTAGRLTQSQVSVTDLPGFANAMKLDCTTADTSIAANEDCSLQYRIEGQDLQQLKKGTSSAEKVTVSFYMKTNKAFTFMCELDDTDNNRFNGQQFTTSTSWTRHTLTFVGDTTGTLDNDNARSMSLNFWIHAGSNFTSGTYTANTWQSRAGTDTNRAVGIGSFYDDTANELQLTGLQMEVGDTATDFEHRSFGEELELCKRYYQKSFIYSQAPVNAGNTTSNSYNGNIGGYCGSNNSGIYSGGHPLSPEMRANPTMVTYGNSNGHWGQMIPTNTGTVSYSAGAGYIGHIRSNGFSVGQNISGNVLMIGFGQWTASAEI